MKPRIFKRGKVYVCRSVLQDKGLRGAVCIGTGKKCTSAYNDWARKYNWYKQGCPGMRWNSKARSVTYEEDVLRQSIQGP